MDSIRPSKIGSMERTNIVTEGTGVQRGWLWTMERGQDGCGEQATGDAGNGHRAELHSWHQLLRDMDGGGDGDFLQRAANQP